MHQSKKDRLLLFLAIALTDLILFKFILFPKYKSVSVEKMVSSTIEKRLLQCSLELGRQRLHLRRKIMR
jgi:hypothetical protein